jgi:hypothetical protein
MSLLDTILAECRIQTDAERRAYVKVCEELRGVEDVEQMEGEAMMAHIRRKSSRKFPKVYPRVFPMRFETAEEMTAYVDVRERLVATLRRRTAIAMAFHERLGQDAAMRVLTADLVAHIVE